MVSQEAFDGADADLAEVIERDDVVALKGQDTRFVVDAIAGDRYEIVALDDNNARTPIACNTTLDEIVLLFKAGIVPVAPEPKAPIALNDWVSWDGGDLQTKTGVVVELTAGNGIVIRPDDGSPQFFVDAASMSEYTVHIRPEPEPMPTLDPLVRVTLQVDSSARGGLQQYDTHPANGLVLVIPASNADALFADWASNASLTCAMPIQRRHSPDFELAQIGKLGIRMADIRSIRLEPHDEDGIRSALADVVAEIVARPADAGYSGPSVAQAVRGHSPERQQQLEQKIARIDRAGIHPRPDGNGGWTAPAA